MNSAECIVKRVDTTGFAHKEILEVDDHRLAVYTKANTELMSGMNAYTDIADDTTNKRVKCDANGKLEVVSTSGVSDMTARTTIGDANTSTNLKCSATGDLSVSDANITKGNATIGAGGSLQSVLIYGKKSDGTLEPLECSGDRLLVDVVELASSGPISVTSALSAVQICGKREDTGNTFHTLKCQADGTLIASSTQLPTTLGQKANASSISTCRSSTAGAYDLSARTTIGTASTTTKLNCNALGYLSVVEPTIRDVQEITNDSGGSALTGQIDSGEYTESIDMSAYRHMNIVIESGETTKKLTLYGSHNNTNFFRMENIMPDALAGGWAYHKQNVCPSYLRLRNNEGSFISFSNFNVFKTN